MDDILSVLAANPTLLEATKAYVLSKFTDEGLDTKLDDKQLGELVRARLTGRVLVGNAFHEIAQFKGQAAQPLQNPAR